MAHVGLIVNPSAGRDIRRLTGGASVVDNYAKRRVAECVLGGLTAVAEPPSVGVMPDRVGIADHAVGEAPDELDTDVLGFPIEETAADTRNAAARFRDSADAVVVLGGDGTTRDVATEIGDVPVVSVSTGTNNVVPSPVDGTIAGAAAAVIATDRVDTDAVTYRHGRIDAESDGVSGRKQLTGLATVGITDRSFIGTRAIIDPTELLGGVVSRAHPADIGLPSVAGGIEPVGPADPAGAAIRLGDPDTTPEAVRAVLAPGMTTTMGVEEHTRLEPGESATFDVADVVVGADGEREIELADATVTMTLSADGPRLVEAEETLRAAAEAGVLIDARPPVEKR